MVTIDQQSRYYISTNEKSNTAPKISLNDQLQLLKQFLSKNFTTIASETSKIKLVKFGIIKKNYF